MVAIGRVLRDTYASTSAALLQRRPDLFPGAVADLGAWLWSLCVSMCLNDFPMCLYVSQCVSMCGFDRRVDRKRCRRRVCCVWFPYSTYVSMRRVARGSESC